MSELDIITYLINKIATRNKDIFLSIIDINNKASKYKKSINNSIKQIKHTTCGYRKFKHLKAKVMLIKGLLNPIKA